MNLGDPELELVDPTPNVHSLFLHFDKLFFWAKLSSRAVVRWSKRMYSCAGICSYDRGGLCDIALSEPLLKLRSRKDLVETLLHEMIHAFLFITNRDRDRDGHGPNFKAHMHRINQATGLNISIYHDFHDEVKLYQTHWWRCNGPCQSRKPHFGIVRRSMNRAPGPSDYWWDDHKRKCGGTFVKIKEPEKQENKKQDKKRASPKPSGDITKYINTNNTGKNISKPILKESNNVPVKSNLVKNSSNTVVISKKNNIVFNPQVTKAPDVFSGKGKTLNKRTSTGSSDVAETVRNVWVNKTLPTISPNSSSNNKSKVPPIVSSGTSSPNSNKHKANTTLIASPPLKMKKIDDYFKTTASSVLKDLYGQDFIIKEVNKNKRLSVVAVSSDLVDCPVCSSKISSSEINKHLDECLNKDIIESISKESKPVIVIDSDGVYEIKDKPPKIKDGPLDIMNVHLNANIKTETYFKIPNKEKIDNIDFKFLVKNETHIKIEPGTSKESKGEQKCSCCDKVVDNLDQHLDECLAFFDNNSTIPTEGASTSLSTSTIVIDDDDDIFDESLTLNATGTKSPCPCCLKMIEQVEMNDHLDVCLNQ